MFTYSAQDRLLLHKQQINTFPEQLIANNTYDELGQLISKKVGGADTSGAVGLQKVDYSYNIRGWLKGINNVDNLTQGSDAQDLFAFKLSYDTPDPNSGTKALYNGNISETYWKTSNDNMLRKYNYAYDDLNRLVDATYKKGNNTLNFYGESLSYDKNGNIKTLKRNTFEDENYVTPIDNLIYTYDTTDKNDNRLLKVFDTSNSPRGFKDNTDGVTDTVNPDYTYDNNGNMKTDANKGITGINYNHLNLPTKIFFGSSTIEYLYNATGQKVEKKVTELGNVIAKTDYLSGGFQYIDNVLQFFPHAEGYVKKINYLGPLNFSYVFNYTDHLGNVRVSYADSDGNGVVGQESYQECTPTKRGLPTCVTYFISSILEENNYYPFGLKHEGYNDGSNQPLYSYRYNSKEYQDELGLNLYDYQARNYDPALGRWMNVDPLAEKYFEASTYNYVMNSPINAIDPDGMDRYLINDNGETILALKEDKDDILFSVGNQKIKNATIESIADTNKDGRRNDDDGVTIKSKGLIGQLENIRAGSGQKGDKYYSSIGEQSKQHENDYLSLFKYVSDNTKVEFSLTFFESKSKNWIELATYRASAAAPGPQNLGNGIPFSKVTWHAHSHPAGQYGSEMGSMGMNGKRISNAFYSDAYMAVKDKKTFPNYVYFPATKNLYNVTMYGIEYIKKINSAKSLKINYDYEKMLFIIDIVNRMF